MNLAMNLAMIPAMNVLLTAADLNDLDRIATTALRLLWRSSWQASVLAAVVLLVQFALRQRIAARWRYALWGIVLLRLMIPVTPSSPWSLFNVAPQGTERNPQLPPGAMRLTIQRTLSSPLAA